MSSHVLGKELVHAAGYGSITNMKTLLCIDVNKNGVWEVSHENVWIWSGLGLKS